MGNQETRNKEPLSTASNSEDEASTCLTLSNTQQPTYFYPMLLDDDLGVGYGLTPNPVLREVKVNEETTMKANSNITINTKAQETRNFTIPEQSKPSSSTTHFLLTSSPASSVTLTDPHALDHTVNVALEMEKMESEVIHGSDWSGETVTFKNTLSCILNSATIHSKIPVIITRREENQAEATQNYSSLNNNSNEKYFYENYDLDQRRANTYHAGRSVAEHQRPNSYNNQHDEDREGCRNLTQASTKRYYIDRDDPDQYRRKICWYHQSGRCKFDSDCWHYLPFRNEAQRDWAY